MPIKPRRKPLPWWLVTILALIAAVAGAAIFSAVLDSGHHEGMPETTGAAVLMKGPVSAEAAAHLLDDAADLLDE
jgi:hypothetical protein